MNKNIVGNLPALKTLFIGLLIGFMLVTGSVLQAEAEQTISEEKASSYISGSTVLRRNFTTGAGYWMT